MEPRPPVRLIQPADAWQLTPPGAGGAELPGVPANEPLTPAAVVLPPDQYAPPGSQQLYALSPLVTVGPGPGARWAVPASIITQVGNNHIARVAVFSVQVLNLLATSLITFSLRLNQAPVPGMTRQVPAAPLLVFARDFDVYLVGPQGSTLDVMVQVDDGAAYQVQAFYTGWILDLAQFTRYYAALNRTLG